MTPPTVAVVGTGLTGAPIARRLAVGGLRVVGWNRTRAKLDVLASDGVEPADSPAGAVADASAVVIDVFDDDAVRAVLEGTGGVLAAVNPGALVVDLSTTTTETKAWFDAEVRKAGARPVAAPFFGSVPEAEAGAIRTAVGCDQDDWEDARELLGRFSRPIRIGTIDQAVRFKLAANVLTFAMVEILAESMALAIGLGVDPEQLLEVLAAGTGVSAPIFQARGRQILDDDYAPRAAVDLARKDLRIILDAADRARVDLPLTRLTRNRFDRAASQGHGGEDMAAVFKLIDPRKGART